MLDAIIHGKLSKEQENMEDLLTSMVFGTLKHLPPERGLIPFLKSAKGDGHDVFCDCLDRLTSVKFQFWPQLKEIGCHSCEPDVLLKAKSNDGDQYLILIEAKYNYGKSTLADMDSESPFDQLAREYENLVRHAIKIKAKPFLLYITSHFSIPEQDIQESQEEYFIKRRESMPVLWISWRHLHNKLLKANEPMLKELKQVLEHLYLFYYDGVPPLMIDPLFISNVYRFSMPYKAFSWDIPEVTLNYSFNKFAIKFTWNLFRSIHLNYRWESK